MATFQTRDDPMVNCPYNKAHRVSRSRIQNHILKCKKLYQDRQLETCPFNAQHRIEKELKQDHIMNCPDRAPVDREIAISANDDEDNRFRGNASVPPYHSTIQHVPTENWDNEVGDDHAPGYDPSQANKNGIFPDMSLCGLKPAERKKYYREMHKRGYNNEESQVDLKKEEVVTKPKGLRQPRVQPEALHQQQKKESQVMCNIGMGRGVPSQNRRIAANIFGKSTLNCDPQSSEQVQENNSSLTGGEALLGIARGRGVPWTPAGADERMFPGQILGEMSQQSPVLGLGRGILASQYAAGAVPGDLLPLFPGEVEDVPETS